MSAVPATVSEFLDGAPPRHIDLETALLDRYARSWLDVQQTRKALAQRELPDDVIAEFARAEKKMSTLLTRTLRKHPLWPWLSQYPGLGGAHTALVIGRIGDPWRYPGQRCSEGHYLPPLYAVGAPCPIAESSAENEEEVGDGAEVSAESGAESDVSLGGIPGADDQRNEDDRRAVCPGVMLPAREGTGVRSLWHWAGLHVLDTGRAPRKTKGQRADWEPRVRASVMQPGGIAEQIVRLSVPHYSDLYRQAKERLSIRVAEVPYESESRSGGAEVLSPETRIEIDLRGGGHHLRAADQCGEIEANLGRPLRLFEADRIARKVAAKAFLGDLLTQWKTTSFTAPEHVSAEAT